MIRRNETVGAYSGVTCGGGGVLAGAGEAFLFAGLTTIRGLIHHGSLGVCVTLLR
jgi:hypothetical protein